MTNRRIVTNVTNDVKMGAALHSGDAQVYFAVNTFSCGLIRERGEVAQFLAQRLSLQYPAHDFARARLRQIVNEFNGCRLSNGPHLVPDMISQFFLKLLTALKALP